MKNFSAPHENSWVPFAVNSGMRIRKENRIDAIYTTSPPHSSHAAGLIRKEDVIALYNIKVITENLDNILHRLYVE